MRHRKSTLNEANEFFRSLRPARCRHFPDEGKGGLVGEFELDEMGGDFSMGVNGTKESFI
jgi:hypothetical protein